LIRSLLSTSRELLPIFGDKTLTTTMTSSRRQGYSCECFMPPGRPWQYAEAGVVAALVAVGFTHVEAAELAIALGELRKGKDRRVTQLIATLSARYHSASSGQAAVPRCEAA